MNFIGNIGLILIVAITISFSADKKKKSEVTMNEFKKHVSYLTSDALKGRLTGSEGDSLAAEYIRSELMKSGCIPFLDKGFQRFRVTDKIINGPANSLMINGTSMKIYMDFAPFAFSQNNIF